MSRIPGVELPAPAQLQPVYTKVIQSFELIPTK